MKTSRPFLFIVLCSLASFVAGAQNHSIQLQIDNDYLTDQYYTAGGELRYTHLLSGSNQSNQMQYEISYGIKIFTPKEFDDDFSVDHPDHPFSGIQELSFGLRWFPNEKKHVHVELKNGVVGPQSGISNLHQAIHDFWDLKEIVGWEYQIVDEYFINLSGSYTSDIPLGEYVALSLQSGVELGTLSNRIGQGVTFRFSKYKPLISGVYMNPLAYGKDQKESSFIFGCTMDYIFTNSLLEGSLFDNPSPFTVEIHPWQLNIVGGLLFRNNLWDFKILGNSVSRQFNGGQGHFYVSLILGKTF